ncbi:unnamed protein product [Pseudo-nitzschia multistriata]|uniref:Uncharacterized protein n=1 Tax=Pseudo-nitzschia multistriata TaxID=183589 RepID=A0A448ZE64_9STRA|nr:unnamed protein product [Pseudo-nitzschia multistriata]
MTALSNVSENQDEPLHLETDSNRGVATASTRSQQDMVRDLEEKARKILAKESEEERAARKKRKESMVEGGNRFYKWFCRRFRKVKQQWEKQ